VVRSRRWRVALIEDHLVHLHLHRADFGIARLRSHLHIGTDECAFPFDVEETDTVVTRLRIRSGVEGRDGQSPSLIVDVRREGDVLAESPLRNQTLDLHAVGREVHLHLVGANLKVVEALDVEVHRELLVRVLFFTSRIHRHRHGLDDIEREGQLRSLRQRCVGHEAKARLVGVLLNARHVGVHGQVEDVRLARRDGAGRLINGQPLAAGEHLHIVNGPAVDVEGVALERPGHVEFVGAHVLISDRERLVKGTNVFGREFSHRGPGLPSVTSRLQADLEVSCLAEVIDLVGELNEHLFCLLGVELRRNQALRALVAWGPVEARLLRIIEEEGAIFTDRRPVLAVVDSGTEPISWREFSAAEAFLDEQLLNRWARRQHRQVVLQRVAASVGNLNGLFLGLPDIGLLLKARRGERELGRRNAFADECNFAGRNFLALNGQGRRELSNALRREGHLEDPCVARLKGKLTTTCEGEVFRVNRHIRHVHVRRAIVPECDHLRARRVVDEEILVLQRVLRDERDRSGLHRKVHRQRFARLPLQFLTND